MRDRKLDWLWSNRPLLISQIIALPIVVLWFLYLYLHDHIAFALVLLCLVPVLGVANLVLITRSRNRLNDPAARKGGRTGEWEVMPTPATSLAGSIAQGHWTGAADMPGSMGRMNASAPLAVLEVDEGILKLRVRPRFFAAMFGAKPLAVTPGQVEAIFPSRGRLRYRAIGIRPLNQPAFYFLTVGSDRGAILSVIASAGFPVEWDSRPFSYA